MSIWQEGKFDVIKSRFIGVDDDNRKRYSCSPRTSFLCGTCTTSQGSKLENSSESFRVNTLPVPPIKSIVCVCKDRRKRKFYIYNIKTFSDAINHVDFSMKSRIIIYYR